MQKVIASIKTLVIYWFIAGFISAIISVIQALVGIYSKELNVLNMFIGIFIAVIIYFYRRKK